MKILVKLNSSSLHVKHGTKFIRLNYVSLMSVKARWFNRAFHRENI